MPSSIDLDSLDLEDKNVQEALAVIAKEHKYNQRLSKFLDMTYPWQRQACNFTKDNKVTGLVCGNQQGKIRSGLCYCCYAPYWNVPTLVQR